jgi:hyperosmotically inducible protein
MNRPIRYTMLAAAAAGLAAMSAGCSDGDGNDTASVDRAVNRAADSVAAATERATRKAAAAIDDATITAKVKSAIVAEPEMSALQIGVDTKDSVVTLTGVVDDPRAKLRATEIARSVAGVKDVVDNLDLKMPVRG